MSTLNVANLNDGTTTVATTFVTNGSAKGYCLFNQGTPAINKSFNTASLTDSSAGKGKINWTNAMSGGETAYSCVTSTLNVHASDPYVVTLTSDKSNVTITASSWSFVSVYANASSAALFDPSHAMATAHGDLA